MRAAAVLLAVFLAGAVTTQSARAVEPTVTQILDCEFKAKLSAVAANPGVTVAFYSDGTVAVPEFNLDPEPYQTTGLLYTWAMGTEDDHQQVLLSRSSLLLQVIDAQKGTAAWSCRKSKTRLDLEKLDQEATQKPRRP